MDQPKAIKLGDVLGAPLPGSELCRAPNLTAHEAKVFTFSQGTTRFEMFVQRHNNHIVAYCNICPHAKLPLDWRPGNFLDQTGKFILCANHGALFRIEDGYCVSGPCEGKWLTPVAIEIKGDVVLVAE